MLSQGKALSTTDHRDSEIRQIERDLVARHAETFVGRDWLFRDIARVTAAPQCRIVLLTGNPGVGKSSVLAELARREPQALAFFLRSDSIHALRSIDARSFLIDLGLRLADARPDLFNTNTDIHIDQEAEGIAGGGEMVGLRIKRLKVSPFEQFAIQVQQRTGYLSPRR